MDVIRGDEFKVELFCPRNQVTIDLRLFGNAVVLQFQVKIFRAENLLEPINSFTRLGKLVLQNRLGNLAREAAGKRDESFLVRFEQFAVNARLVIIAFQVRGSGELDEIFVAGLVLGKQDEMIINVAPATGGFFLETAAGSHVNFAADDGFDAFRARRLVKINRAIHHAVVGDGKRGKFKFVGLVHQPVKPACAIEQRILGVQMQMNKVSVRHEIILPPVCDAAQVQTSEFQFALCKKFESCCMVCAMSEAMHLTTAQLEAGMDEIRRSPKDGGAVEMLVRRPQKEEREILEVAELHLEDGLLGDTWKTRGNPPKLEMQLTVMNSRAAALVAGEKSRWPLAGDQIYVDLDLSMENLPAGTQLAIGSAVIEISAPPHTGCKKFQARFGLDALEFVNSPEGRQIRLRGLNAKIVQAGTVRVGDKATRLPP